MSSKKFIRPRAAAVLIEAGKIAMIERQRSGKLFYVFPGGHVDPGEKPEESVVREIKEELGLDVQVIRLIAQSTYQDRPHFYYLVETLGGEFGSGHGKELQRPADSLQGSVTPIWIDVESFSHNSVYPEKMARWVEQALIDGFQEEIYTFVEFED